MPEKETNETPMRMCIACRTRAPQESLLRFVRSHDATLAFDLKNQIDGRGAFTCATVSCVKKACERKAFQRALETTQKIVANDILEELKVRLQTSVLRNLGLALRTKQCELGRECAVREIEKGQVEALVLAYDLSERSLHMLSTKSVSHAVPVFLGPSKGDIAQALSLGETGVVALKKGRISERVMEDLARMQSLGMFEFKGTEEQING